jgi:hypothetical protein
MWCVLGKHIQFRNWTSVDGVVMLGQIPGNEFFKHEIAFILSWSMLLKDMNHLFLFFNCSFRSTDGAYLVQYRPTLPVSVCCNFLKLCSTWTNVLKTVVNGNMQWRNCCISICITFRYSSFSTSHRALHTSFTIIPIVHTGTRNKYCSTHHLEHVINS